jgi:hypothetical protein
MRHTAIPCTPTSPPPSRGRRRQSSVVKNSPPLVGGVRGGGCNWVLVCLGLVLMLLVLPSCGRKADPFLPQEGTNAKVANLSGAWQEGYIELKGSIRDASESEATVTGAHVNYAIYPVDEPPCDGCPIDFRGFHTFGSEAVEKGQFSCKIPGVERGNIYYFEVQLVGAKGGLGPASNMVKVVVQ